ncbi:uncharacterized protein LOC143204739 isoform X1 [Rhynchophorus ferrugineus]|uniref:uncharacterized protein LOC143204739 isoform X1 n=1 Tax=Rhynchophorus ferrugineus TaxID=354439 RepID=UPI003FCDA9DA
MKWLVSSACVFCVLFFTVYAAPATTSLQVTGSAAGGGLGSILSNIDLPGLLQGVNSFVKLVGAFCPPLSQVLDNVIQNVTSTAFRVFGRAILRSGGLGGSSGGSSSGRQSVSVVLPTFPPDDDYEDEDETTTLAAANSLAKEVEAVTENAVTLYTSSVEEADDSANTIAKRHVRVTRDTEDQEGAESAPQPGQEAADIDDQDRNKRYLPFGGGDGHSGGAGSGNFLFDIIRSTADKAARTVGTVYRMVAGTDDAAGSWSFTLPSLPDATKTLSTASSTLSARVLPAKLVAGSGATEESDEHDAGAGGVAELDLQKSGDGHTEGIPGPITRLFVIANRGLANLIQDLILRLAQTSERLVNFKARLITSLI